MSDMDRAFADLVTANPIPDGASAHPEALTATALLEVLDTRSRELPVDPAPVTPARRSAPTRRVGLLVAAAVFTVIVLSVGIIALFTAGDEDDVVDITSTTLVTTSAAPTSTAPPTTTEATTTSAAPTTTTTEAPQVNPAEQAVVDAFVATFNSGDWEAALAALAPDARVFSDLIGGGETGLPLDEFGELISRWLRFSAIQQSRMTISSCTPLEDGGISCRGTLSDVVVDQSPLGEAALSVTFGVSSDGLLTAFLLRENEALMNAAYGHFFRWLDEAHSGESFILSTRSGVMSLSDDALELLPIRVAEWIATLEE